MVSRFCFTIACFSIVNKLYEFSKIIILFCVYSRSRKCFYNTLIECYLCRGTPNWRNKLSWLNKKRNLQDNWRLELHRMLFIEHTNLVKSIVEKKNQCYCTCNTK